MAIWSHLPNQPIIRPSNPRNKEKYRENEINTTKTVIVHATMWLWILKVIVKIEGTSLTLSPTINIMLAEPCTLKDIFLDPIWCLKLHPSSRIFHATRKCWFVE